MERRAEPGSVFADQSANQADAGRLQSVSQDHADRVHRGRIKKSVSRYTQERYNREVVEKHTAIHNVERTPIPRK